MLKSKIVVVLVHLLQNSDIRRQGPCTETVRHTWPGNVSHWCGISCWRTRPWQLSGYLERVLTPRWINANVLYLAFILNIRKKNATYLFIYNMRAFILVIHIIRNIITWTINRRNAIGHTPKIAESINLDNDPFSLILTGL